MNTDERINEKRRQKLNNLWKEYENVCKTIKSKEYEFDNHEGEYKTASKEKRRELLHLLPSDDEYRLRSDLFNEMCKELHKGELEDFFHKGLLW